MKLVTASLLPRTALVDHAYEPHVVPLPKQSDPVIHVAMPYELPAPPIAYVFEPFVNP